MNQVEKRRATLINIAYVLTIVALFFVAFKYLYSLFLPFIIAFAVAAILQKPINAVAKKTHIKKSIISFLSVLIVLVVVLSLLSFVGYRIVVEVRGFIAFIYDKADNLPDLIKTAEEKIFSLITFLPDSIEQTVADATSNFVDRLLVAVGDTTVSVPSVKPPVSNDSAFDFSLLTTPLSGLWSTAKQIPSILIAIVIGVIASFFMTLDYERLMHFFEGILSDEKRRTFRRVKNIIRSSFGKLVKSYVIIIFITFSELVIGLNILKVAGVYNGEYLLVVAIVTACLDILPVLGTGTVLIPWVIYSFITGGIGTGIGLLILYAVITVIRQVIEPKLVAANLGLPPVITLIALYTGLQLFGVVGMIVLPIAIVIIKILNDEGVIHIRGNSTTEKNQERTAEQPKAENSVKESDTSSPNA